MSNVLATCSIIAKRALPILENMLTFAKYVNRDYEQEYTENQSRGYSPGNTINIKLPPRYTYRAGRVAVPQGTVENTVPITLSQGGCDLQFSSNERTTSLQQLDQKIAAAMAPVANEIDRQGLALAHFSTFNTLNTAGAQPNTQALALAAVTGLNQRLDEMGAPSKDKNRFLIANPALNANLIQGFAGLFNAQSTIGKMFDSGMLQNALGIQPDMDQNVDVHANGAGTASNINGANQTGSTITVAATGAGTITRGTTITLPGVFAVTQQGRTTTSVLANFIVTADVLQGATSIPISPAIVTSGAFQNVSASPTTAQPFIILGAASTSYSTNVAFHKDAFTLAMVPLWAPPGGKGVIDVSQMTHKGFTMKVTEFYDGINDNSIIRIDVLFGYAATYPQLSAKYYTL